MMIKKLKNNFSLKLLAFLFAFMLWLIVVNIDDPVMTKTFTNIPVTVEHSEILTEQNKTYQIVERHAECKRSSFSKTSDTE